MTQPEKFRLQAQGHEFDLQSPWGKKKPDVVVNTCKVSPLVAETDRSQASERPIKKKIFF